MGGCDFDFDDCSSDADCPVGEICSDGFLGTACQLPECSTNDDCGCGEACVENECELDDLDQNPCPVCKEIDEACTVGADCCSGECGDLGVCVDPFLVCADPGESCSEDLPCCSGVCADGVCDAQKCEPNGDPELVAESTGGLVAESASTLYWVSDGALRSIPKVGGEVTVLASNAGAGSCIARFGDRTSWCGDAGDIWQLLDGAEAPTLFAVAPAAVSSLVDSEGGLVWADVTGAIMAAPAPLPSEPQLLATATSSAPAITVDASTLFFADGSTVNAVPLAGGAVLPLFVGDPQGGPITALADDETSVYFAHGSSMTAVSKAGGAPSSLGFAETARLIALSATHVFYADTFIARIPKAGGNTVAVVNAVAPPSLLVDDQCVYWVDAVQGRIMKVWKN
jgi:hypothetical protein